MLKHVVRWSFSLTRCYSTQVDKGMLGKLRKKTGFAFINCKNALVKFNNDFEKAEQWLLDEAKKEGWAKATKLQNRAMSQGLIGVVYEKNCVTMIEVNCETDYVAKTEKFKNFVSNLSAVCHQHNKSVKDTKSVLLKSDIHRIKSNDQTVADMVAMEIGNLGENMQLRRALYYKGTDDLQLSSYVHGPEGKSIKINHCIMGKYGSVVQFKQFQNKNKVLPGHNIGQQIGQHIVGMNPKSVGNYEDIPVESEEESKNNIEDENHSVENAENMEDDQETHSKSSKNEVEESRLIFQEFLIDSESKVYEVLIENNMEVTDFVRFEVGEELAEESDESDTPGEKVSAAV